MRTMKIMKRMMGLAAAILALSACSESEDLLSAFHSDPNAVRITAEVGKASANGFTRSYPLGDAEAQKKFNNGDEISVKADGQDAVTYQLNGNEWQPKESGKFLKWESDEMTFTAYYPASFDGNLDKVTLPAEYDEAKLAAYDFMSYSGKQSNTKGNQLTLTMERKMARVVVEIAGFNDQYAGATIKDINSLSICGIKAYKHSDKKFYALIKPCEAQNSETFISLDVAEGESKTTTEKLTGIPALTAGNSYSYQLKVGKNKVSVSGITVKEWTTGEITGGKAEEAILPPYVTFKAAKAQTFTMTATGNYTISGLEYSVNGGDWTRVEKDKGVTFGGTNGILQLRGTNNLSGTASPTSSKYSTITFTDKNVKVACTGDIRTLLDWKNYENVETENARFCYLFKSCKALTSAPKLPATKLANYCYNAMFYNCSSLEAAPELPAETLAKDCYNYMFEGCKSLKVAPALPSKTLANNCYASMFAGCSALESAPALPATKMASKCYYYMFYGCKSLKVAPELLATELADDCYKLMLYGCTNLSSVTMLAPSDQITENCFTDWLTGAGISATSRKLIVQDEAAYNALVEVGLPDKWKTGTEGATVEYTPKQ